MKSMWATLAKLDTREVTAVPAWIQGPLDQAGMMSEMRSKLQVKTSEAVSKLSEYALIDPRFNPVVVKAEE